MEMGVEGIMISPGYSYEKAPDQQHFLGRARTRQLFRAILVESQEDLEVQHVAAVSRVPDGQAQLRVHAVGHARLQHLRLAGPCYLLQDGYAETFKELMETTEVGKVRHRVRQSQVRQLHGALRL